ncbi:MAG: hypothetical protein ACK5QW_00965 [Cyanobacteriota bacterium]
MTSDPQGLNSRDAQGRMQSVLAYGAVVDSDLSNPTGSAWCGDASSCSS